MGVTDDIAWPHRLPQPMALAGALGASDPLADPPRRPAGTHSAAVPWRCLAVGPERRRSGQRPNAVVAPLAAHARSRCDHHWSCWPDPEPRHRRCFWRRCPASRLDGRVMVKCRKLARTHASPRRASCTSQSRRPSRGVDQTHRTRTGIFQRCR